MRPDDTAPDGAVRIPLRRRDGSIRAYTVVDAADAEWVNQWQWCLTDTGYAVRNVKSGGRRTTVKLHRELLGLVWGDGLEGDHLNRDRLDNRRSNLRAVPKFGNRQNVTSSGASSSYRGVTWDRQNGKWLAQVKANGRNHYVGLFSDEIAAAEAARLARQRLLPYAVD